MEVMSYRRTAEKAAREAGKILAEKLGKVSFREKHPADLVTEADIASQNLIEEILLSEYPDHFFIGEEQGKPNHLSEQECGLTAPAGNPLTWIVDPLDGTTNFVHQVPHFGPSIALASGNEILCGVIFNPITNECWSAAKGQGVFLNGRPAHVSRVTRPEEALVSFSFPTSISEDSPLLEAFLRLLPHCQAVRRSGSTALNLTYIASGRFDAQFNGSTTHPWDVAAGFLMVLEAGGIVTNDKGGPFDLARPAFLATSTPELHESLLKIVQQTPGV